MQQLYAYGKLTLGVNNRKSVFHSEHLQKKNTSSVHNDPAGIGSVDVFSMVMIRHLFVSTIRKRVNSPGPRIAMIYNSSGINCVVG